MPQRMKIYFLIGSCLFSVFLFSCNNASPKNDQALIADPAKINDEIADDIKASLDFAEQHEGKLDDSTRLSFSNATKLFYSNNNFSPIWSGKGKWEPISDSLYQYVENAVLDGLFRDDYHYQHLKNLRTRLNSDSLLRMDPAQWTRADLLLTDGFMHIVHDLKQGRLQPDSITLSSDTALAETYFSDQLTALMAKPSLKNLFTSLQPRNKDYWELKNGIPAFLDSMDNKVYTYVNYPYRKNDPKDSLIFIKTLQKRLNESGLMDNNGQLPDTAQLRSAISKYQKLKGLTVDGKLSSVLIRTLNISDAERYKRIAITLDRYKQLPDKMPEKYIWVNLPGFYLKVINHDTIALLSKIICGKPDTRTPLLNSQITDMVTYPTWTVPTSIIAKSYLPKLKNNPNYLNKIGLKLLNGKGEAVNAAEVDWAKYSKGIPFKVMQESGDNNALGVMKFNFNNPYAVYLHDTNERYLFKNATRALSHGCVRVQEWQKLAFFIARNDSTLHNGTEGMHYNTDSIVNWIAHKERHRIEVRASVPLFIRYFSCEGKNGKIQFYSDIYGEDKVLRDKYFAKK